MTAVAAPQGNVAEEALRTYGKLLEGSRHAGTRSLAKPRFAEFARKVETLRRDVVASEECADVLGELARDMTIALEGGRAAPGEASETLVIDGEKVLLCVACRLPLGQTAYDAGDQDTAGVTSVKRLIHGECKAQELLRNVRSKEQDRVSALKALKQRRREEFEIGWKATWIPKSAELAARVGCTEVPQGMCCIVSEEGAGVRVASTLEPAASVNLEYLATALQVRRTEGREPLFSLDPVDNGKITLGDPEAAMQHKRFEPEYLAGTAVGEVMFQADFHLKELSFGEFAQPVVGMKSVLDHSEVDNDESDWQGREWFVVRKADMFLSGDKVLVPYLKMGVEAREQVLGGDGLEDAALTRPDHPLVKYADEFTHNFDLIAERKSVIFQLREVAKASIMAKYLLECGLDLPEVWYGNLASESPAICCWEVPQLWNDRHVEKVEVLDGRLQPDRHRRMHGIYGGVDFGIDRFRLSAPSRVATSVVAGRAVLGRPATSLMASTRTGLAVGPARQFARLSAPLGATMSMAASRAGLGAPRVAAGLSMGAPQGVDLNLDKFNLSAHMECDTYAGELQARDASLAIGAAFWAELEQGSSFSEEDRSLLMDIFHPHLSDRREDGDQFVPPPTNSPHITKLKQLVKAERVLRSHRKEHFFGEAFNMEVPGPLFPSSFTNSVALAAGPVEHLTPRPEYLGEQDLLSELVKGLAPSFDRCTEDAARFRIYRVGALEVRTVQEYGGEEVVGAIFSISEHGPAAPKSRAAEDDDVVEKVTEYIERSPDAPRCRPYVVIETRKGDVIVTEKPSGGPAVWAENPAGLDRRNALARALRSSSSSTGAPMTVKELRYIMAQQSLKRGSPCQYSQHMFCHGAGLLLGEPSSGFLRFGGKFAQREFAMPRASCAFRDSRFGA